ncbi:MAG: DivIVA domain-containing protein [Actinomycetes bacterium]
MIGVRGPPGQVVQSAPRNASRGDHMALTPEQVVEKRFQATKFREGYDQDEVDDFLDEVVNELRRLTAENDQLRSKLTACEQRVGELTRAGAAGEQAPAPTTQQAEVPVAAATASEDVTARDDQPATVSEPAPAATAATGASAAMAASEGDDADRAAGVLALAQRLHDEHVRSGEQKRDQLINEAREQAARLVGEAEQKQRETLGSLDQQRTNLERRIDQLRTFERDFRSRLKAYLESKLNDLDSADMIVPDGAGESDGGYTVGAGASS